MIVASPPLRGLAILLSVYYALKFSDKRSKIVCAFPKLKTSAKSVQTTAEVCADYT